MSGWHRLRAKAAGEHEIVRDSIRERPKVVGSVLRVDEPLLSRRKLWRVEIGDPLHEGFKVFYVPTLEDVQKIVEALP